MTEDHHFVRRNRVDERAATAIGLLAGVIAATGGARPYEQPVSDWLFVVAAVGVVVWAAASAPWWAVAASAGIAAVTAVDSLVGVVAGAAFVLGLYVGIRRRDQSTLRAFVAAVAVNSLIRSDLDGFHGLSAVVGISVGLALLIAGLLRRPRPVRRYGWTAIGALGAVVALGLLGAALAGLTARSDLARASGQARQAIDAVNGGDYQTASVRFDDASRAFESADRRLGGLLTLPALAIPGVSQNIAAGTDISAAAAKAASEAAIALESVDPGALTVVDGSIDIDAIRAVEEPLRRVEAALADLRAVTDSVDSPWLLGPFQTRLAELDNEFGTSQVRLGTAIDAVRLAPRMLGADESRRYLVLFTTPAEVRGIAGFIGNYATVEVDDGKIRVAEFGRRSDLDTYLGVNPAFCDGCRQDVLDRYGIFGLDIGPEGGVIPTVWLNLTMPASFPNVAETAQILYPQSGGEPIDGVIVVDPYVIEALMEYTGPISVPELDVTVTADNAAEFILRDQYVLAGDDALGGIDNESRIDALQTLGEAVIQRLLSGALPEPSQLARDLGPLATEHRLMMWTDDELEQQLLDEAGLLGAMPELGDDGGFGVVVANTGESKIDVFLERDTDVRIETTPGGARQLVAEVTLRNNAPSSGLPLYMIGNAYGLPTGSSRLKVNFFGPPTLTSATRYGADIPVESLPEAGWMGYSTDVVIGPGDQVDFELRFALPPRTGDDSVAPAEWVQPLASRDG